MKTWVVEHRYSDFRNLHTQVMIISNLKMLQISKTRKHLPKFPPKKINKMQDQVIESRKISLASKFNIYCDSFRLHE